MLRVPRAVRTGHIAVAAAVLTAAQLGHDVSHASPITIDGQTILDARSGEPIRGFHAMYQGVPSTRAEMAADLQAMKQQFGLSGFTFEIGWNEIEPSRGHFQFPSRYDTLLDVAAEKGLYVNVLFVPHYTPHWVYQQGIDVRNYDYNGTPANGMWLNYCAG